jgi:hypothetical protein
VKNNHPTLEELLITADVVPVVAAFLRGESADGQPCINALQYQINELRRTLSNTERRANDLRIERTRRTQDLTTSANSLVGLDSDALIKAWALPCALEAAIDELNSLIPSEEAHRRETQERLNAVTVLFELAATMPGGTVERVYEARALKERLLQEQRVEREAQRVAEEAAQQAEIQQMAEMVEQMPIDSVLVALFTNPYPYLRNALLKRGTKDELAQTERFLRGRFREIGVISQKTLKRLMYERLWREFEQCAFNKVSGAYPAYEGLTPEEINSYGTGFTSRHNYTIPRPGGTSAGTNTGTGSAA